MVDVLAESRDRGIRSAGGSSQEPDRAVAAADVRDPPIEDVWSRTQPKYQIRALVLLLFNLVLFCGLCVFTHWLHRATPFDFSPASYFSPARFWAADSPNLNDFILEPISVLQTPIHAVVLGLLVASIVAVPIVVSILYRFASALPFLAAVFVFAHMPWMAFTLAGSCVLASVKPFRLRFRFAAALLAMLPVLLYLYLATRGGTEQLGAASPIEKLLLAAPWVLAILAACAMLGLVLSISRMVDYRPGGVAPVVAIMFATPVVLFHARVGVDELEYRVIESRFGPRSETFEPVRSAEPGLRRMLARIVVDNELYGKHREQLLRTLGGENGPARRLVRGHLQSEFLADRERAYAACDRFIANHPTSRYVPNVLYIQAGVLDTRLDVRGLYRLDPQRMLYSGFPHVQSETVWLTLLRNYPDSPLALAATVRLAEIQLRRGETDAALRNLRTGLRLRSVQSQPATRPARLLSQAAALSSLGFQPAPFLLEARRLIELIVANRDDPVYGNEPLRRLASLDPHRVRYGEQLLRAIKRYQDSSLADNLLARWILSEPDASRRFELLEAFIHRFPDSDALPEVLFRFADLEIQTIGVRDAARRASGVSRLREIAARFPDSCWSDQARERLALLDVAPAQAAARP